MSRGRQAVGLVVVVIVTFAAAGIGSVFTSASVSQWYPALEKPS